MNERMQPRSDSLTDMPVVSRHGMPDPSRKQRSSQTLLLGPLQLQDIVITTESLPVEDLRAGQTGTVVAEWAADAVLVDFDQHVAGRHAVVPVPISCLRLVQQGSKADFENKSQFEFG